MWECSHCGHEQAKWTGSCVQCKSWNSFMEKLVLEQDKFVAKKHRSNSPVRLKDVQLQPFPRISTHLREFDRLLGGGVVPGALTLIGGEPGVGKSTLLMQVSEAYARAGLKVLYISGEESVDQTKLRAERLGIDHDNLFLLNETSFSEIKHHIDQCTPQVIIVDSIQILYKEEVLSSPGSVSQVRELAQEFMHIAKGYGITTFLIGHVTKSGEIAGPRVLEHIVDTVLDFEGDREQGLRILRSMKNRFGPTDDIALFQMQEKGLKEVENPSEALLSQRSHHVSGSVIVPSLEGIRSILIEIQALVTPTAYANPTRKSAGIDPNRLALLLAVLEKRVGYRLYNQDVFVAVAGGIRIIEPAIDLGIIIAIASSLTNQCLDPKTVVLGEVGLGGEVRNVSRIASRLQEAFSLGFARAIVPKKALAHIKEEKIALIGVNMVDEAIEAVFQKK